MNWPLIRDTLQQTISDITGIAPALVVWKGSFQESSVVIDTRIVLASSAVNAVGVLEQRRQNDTNPANDQIVSYLGQRTFTLSITVEAQNQNDGATAREIADKIRMGLWFESVRDSLRASGLAVANTLSINHLDFLASGRTVSRAVLDFLMIAYDLAVDTSPDSGDWIGEAQVSGPVKDTSGTTLSTINEDVTTP